MFWELPTVRDALNDLCKKWFYNDSKAYIKNTIDISEDSQTPIVADTTCAPPSISIVGSQKEKGQCVELGFVEKLIELWRLRRRILEDKTEILVSGFLARYNHEAGKAIMNKTLTYRSSNMMKVFKARNKALTMEERSRASLAMYNNQIVQYKALLLQCEKD